MQKFELTVLLSRRMSTTREKSGVGVQKHRRFVYLSWTHTSVVTSPRVPYVVSMAAHRSPGAQLRHRIFGKFRGRAPTTAARRRRLIRNVAFGVERSRVAAFVSVRAATMRAVRPLLFTWNSTQVVYYWGNVLPRTGTERYGRPEEMAMNGRKKDAR